jgi:hypothetical protein
VRLAGADQVLDRETEPQDADQPKGDAPADQPVEGASEQRREAGTHITSSAVGGGSRTLKGAHEVRDVQNIADILVDPEGTRERRDHWDKTAHALPTGAILHVLYAEEEKTLARVASFLAEAPRLVALRHAHPTER